jgi:DTW domain-containing protein YfiP
VSRPICDRCLRPASVCICAAIVPVEARTKVVILQHEDEAANHIGTARIAHLSLPGSLLLVGDDFAGDDRLERALAEPGRTPVLLWPKGGAVPVDRFASEGPTTLVVIDGTWPHARRIVSSTPALRGLPRVTLPAGERSRYRIRRQPRREFLSTIEAAVRALGVLERDPDRFRPLLAAFDAMVDIQIARAAAEGRQILVDPRRERSGRPFERQLEGELDHVVLVHGETVYRRDEGKLIPVLVQWLALRPSTGERFEAIVRPPLEVPDWSLAYLGLARDEVEHGVDGPALRERWRAFAREGDVCASWGYFAANAFKNLTGERPAPLDLRAAAKRVVLRPVRVPEDALLELELPTPEPLGRGRGGRRLAALRAILLEIREGRRIAR